MSEDCKYRPGIGAPETRWEPWSMRCLYLGPSALRLAEPMPADIGLDADYGMELKRRDAIAGFPVPNRGTLNDDDRLILNRSENPLNVAWKPSDADLKQAAQDCLDRKKQSGISSSSRRDDGISAADTGRLFKRSKYQY